MQSRAAETRETLLLAAAHEFDEHGYGACSLQRIAERLGKTKGALGYHFPSKASLALSIVERFYEELPGLAVAYRTGERMDVRSLVALSLHVAEQFRDDVMVRAAVRLQRDADVVEVPLPAPYVNWLALTEAALTDAQSNGQLVEGVDVVATARVLVAGFFGIQQVASALGHRAELTAWVLDMWRVILPGVVGDEAERILIDVTAGASGAGGYSNRSKTPRL
ncbi:ScbR family autoregulator-binding transcription factor [Rathayibacter sp. KR2-224]|uniref:ScbR family autoregulator-binding transcription factor n=1 Tax=Rathayibacter sp. KR2-224 TaxID=3400913 RepID=UPI003C0FBFD3